LNLFRQATELQQISRNCSALEERFEMTRQFIEKQRQAISILLEANAFERESITIQRDAFALECRNLSISGGTPQIL
jgi:hypothetical protein